MIVTLLAVAHGVARAQGDARWSWQKPHAKVLPTDSQKNGGQQVRT